MNKIILLLGFSLFVNLKEDEEPTYVMEYKLYFSNNDTYTVIDILDYSNIT